MHTLHLGARAFMPAALAGAILFSLAPSTPASATGPITTEASQIIQIAKTKLGRHWRYGARGPNAFDCSGLVIYAYRKAGDGKVIRSGSLASARAMYRYFKAHGKASRSNPMPGDLVIWGGGTHVGIYIGNGKAISTLTSGVRIHAVHAVTARFTAYLHTGMSGRRLPAAAAVATATPVPTTPTATPVPTDLTATPVPTTPAATPVPVTTEPVATPVPTEPTATPATILAVTAASTKATTAVTAVRTPIRHVRYAVNLRRGPGVAYLRLRTLSSGARLAVLGRRADSRGRTWYHVRVAGRTGWVAGWLTR